MTTNPADKVERVTVKRRAEFAVLSPTEVQALARHAGSDQDAAIILVAAFTGLRLGSLVADIGSPSTPTHALRLVQPAP